MSCVLCGERPVHSESGERQCCIVCWRERIDGLGPDVDELDDELDRDVAEIRKALLWDPLTLHDALRDESPAVEPVPGTAGLLYRGQAAEFFSERGHGKSIALAVVLASAAHHGERVLILDRENGGKLVADRFRDIVAAHPEWEHVLKDGSLDARFFPPLDPNWSGDVLAEALRGYTVVVLDSSREFVGQLGGNTNSDDDWTRLCNLAVTPLRQRGVAVAITDNVGHTETRRPKGAGAKLDAIPIAYLLKAAEKFNQTKLGKIEFTCTRSRFGDEGRKWTMRIGDGVFDMPMPASDSPSALKETFWRACIDVLAETEPLGRDPLIEAVRKHDTSVTWGKNDKLRNWLGDFASDLPRGIVHTPDGYRRTLTPEAGSTRGHPPEPDPDPPPPYKGRGQGAGLDSGSGRGQRVGVDSTPTTLADLNDYGLLAAAGAGATLENGDSGVAS